MSFFDCVADAEAEGSLRKEFAGKAQTKWRYLVDGHVKGGMPQHAAEALASRQVKEQLAAEVAKKRHETIARVADMQKARIEAAMGPDGMSLTDKMTQVDFQARGIERAAWGKISETIEKGSRTNVFSQTRDPLLVDAIVKAKVNGHGPNAEANEMADAIHEMIEWLRHMANMRGAVIGKLQGYWPTSHNRNAILNLGLDAEPGMARIGESIRTAFNQEARDRQVAQAKVRWVDRIAPVLDWTRITDPATGIPFQAIGGTGPTPDMQRAFLNEVFDNIIFGKEARTATYGQSQGTATARRVSAERVLHFKSAEDWIAYNKDFGTGDPITSLMDHVQSMANDIAQMGEFGPTPALGLDYRRQLKEQRARDRGSVAAQERAKADANRARRMMNVLNGPGVPQTKAQEWVATFFATNRQVLSAAQLDRAILMAPPDLANTRMAAKVMGMNENNAVAKFVGALPSLSRDELLRMGWIADTWANPAATQARQSSEVGAMPWAQKLNNFSMRVQGLAAWTDRLRGIAYQEWSGQLAGLSKTRFADLDMALRQHFEFHGITSAEWDQFRNSKGEFKADNGATFLAPVYWREATTLPPEQADAIFLKMQAASEHFLELSVPSRSLKMDSYVDPAAYEMARGTVAFEVMKSGTMYKRFVLAMTANMARNFQSRPTPMSKAAYLVEHAAVAAMLALVGLQAREVLKGNEPMPMTPELMMKALLAGGGLAIMGDLFTTGSTSWGGGFASYLTGPVIQQMTDLGLLTVGNLSEAVTDMRNGDPVDTNAVPELRRFVQRYFVPEPPWAGPVIDRMLMDQFQILLDPESLDALQQADQQRQSRTGNPAWWAKGEAAP